ncbi:MAG TPA: excinuclease ABC subunit UvrC [bacterium]|nr:excinuclease ABC subunit UvrC [bacterium]
MPVDETKNKREELKKVAAGFPDAPGVYLFKNAANTILYVGKAVSLRKRTASYFNLASQSSPKVRSLVDQSSQLEYVLTGDESQALLLESNLIKRHRPRYNVVLRDDKSYPYLKLTMKEDFPRILISRRPSADGSKYYGPYPNLKLRELIKMVYRYFNIRDCNIEIDGKADRACLSYQIKQCPAPCIGLIQKEAYSELVDKLQWFLEGKHDDLMEHVKKEMLKAADRQEYEEAAKCRDLLGTIQQMQSGYTVIVPVKKDIDVFAFAQGLAKVLVSVLQVRQGKVIDHIKLTLENEMESGLEEVASAFFPQYYVKGLFVPEEILISSELTLESGVESWLSQQRGNRVFLKSAKEEWRLNLMNMAEKNVLTALKEDIAQTALLKELQSLLNLKDIPRNIACFDISTLQGSFTVGSAIFFRDGVPEKSRYRKFKIKEIQGQDDFRSHQEMMRRYLRLLEREGNPIPDLFLIDGGKGQLSSVQAVLESELTESYGLASLAKREEEVFVPGQSNPVDFKGHLKARHLLQRIRDESHRFAVGYHRIIRDRQAVTSLLQKVKGIGPTRLRSLLNRFDSVKEIEKAPLDELETVPGFSRELAHQLFKAFHAQD